MNTPINFRLLLLLFSCLPVFLEAQKAELGLPLGHEGRITALEYSKDGRYIFSTDSYSLKLWDVKSGKVLQSSDETGALQGWLSPDANYALFTTNAVDPRLLLWNIEKNTTNFVEGGEPGVAFFPKGRKALVWGEKVFVYDCATGAVTKNIQLPANSSIVNAHPQADGQSAILLIAGSDVDGNTARFSLERWNLNTGKPLATFPIPDFQAWDAVFSEDGKQALLIGQEGANQLWDTEKGSRIRALPSPIPLYSEYPPYLPYQEEGAFTVKVSFTPEGLRAITAEDFSTIRIWDLDNMKTLFTIRDTEDDFSNAVFSPDYKQVLSGGWKGRIKLWDKTLGSLENTLESKALRVMMAWKAPDGQGMFAGAYDGILRYWNFQEGRVTKAYAAPDNRMAPEDEDWSYMRPALGASADGQTVFTWKAGYTPGVWKAGTASPRLLPNLGKQFKPDQFKAFSTDGQRIYLQKRSWETNASQDSLTVWNVAADAPLSSSTFPVFYTTPDGEWALVNLEGRETVEVWNLPKEQKQSEFQFANASSRFAYHVAFSAEQQSVIMWFSEEFIAPNTLLYWPSFSGQPRGLEPGLFRISKIAFLPNGQQALAGTEAGELALIDLRSGAVVRKLEGHQGIINDITVSDDGRYAFSAGDDRSLRIWDLSAGKELASLYTLEEDKWVVMSPEGLFDASPEAMQLMYFKVGREVVELEQLKERYYEPGLLAKIMGAVRDEKREVATLSTVELYPEIEASIQGEQIQVKLTARSGGMGKLSVFVNGKEMVEDANPGRQASLSIPLKQFEKFMTPGQENTIGLRVYNASGWLKSQLYELTYKPPLPSPGDPTFSVAKNPSLYAIVIGTADYNGEQLDLKFPDKDAAAIGQAFEQAGKALFGENITVRLLNTEEATPSSKENIRAAFQEVAAVAKPQDVFIIYFSGHGITYGAGEQAQFYYITKDVGGEDISDPELRKNFTISSQELTDWLTHVAARKQVMILDACNSGKVVEDLLAGKKSLNSSQIRALDRMKDRTGMFVLSGSAADKVSYEASRYGQGLLTYSLLQGMSGLALKDGKYVDVVQLFQYARDRVPELAREIGGIQTPMLAFPMGGESFDIGMVDENVQIPVAQVKPVFVRNIFQEESAFNDVLGITKVLEGYFQQITARGARAELIYIDVPQYKDAYSIKGRYLLQGEAISLQAKLFKGNTPLGDIQAEGTDGELNALVEDILKQAFGLLQKK